MSNTPDLATTVRDTAILNPADRFTFSSVNTLEEQQLSTRDVANEVAVAIELNGFGYAVLMASPIDLDDLLFGFLRSERVITSANEIVDFDIFPLEVGIIARVSVAPAAAERITDRVRHRASDSSCGLCGVENLEQAMRSLPPISSRTKASDSAIFAALATLPDRQPLNRATGAVHAAALCCADGSIRLVREDIGRHNAFDKLLGAMLRDRIEWEGGFALLSSRCSYELVEKAVVASCPMLVTISAPTGLALARAAEAGLELRVLARADTILSPTDQT